MEVLERVKASVRECGEVLLSVRKKEKGIESKEGIGNFVTVYDRFVEKKLKKDLREIIPGSHFIGEEEDVNENILKEGYTWIVDPIDGTLNFAKDMNLSAVSVGLLKDGKQELGVCYNPYADEMFTAEAGKGAYLNGEKIHVSFKKLSEGIFFTGSAPYYGDLREKTLMLHGIYSRVANDYRRTGSAVLEMCHVAAGRAEMYFEAVLQPWDYAAASLIVKEAGGRVTTLDGEEISFGSPISIIASNSAEDYLAYLK